MMDFQLNLSTPEKRINMNYSVIGLFLILVGAIFPQNLSAQPPHQYANNRLLVRFTDNASPRWDIKRGTVTTGYEMLDAINRKYACVKARKVQFRRTKKALNLFVLEFKDSINVLHAVKDYYSTKLFKYVEPDYKVKGAGVMNTHLSPNDPRFNVQWALRNNGTFSLSPAVEGADIDITRAWDITSGDSSIIVAISDSGLKWDHPELAGRIWRNRAEIPNNGIDDDDNGFIDDVRGWDFVNADIDPADDHGHGTNVTGILGANSNNSLGFAGVDWHCKIMPLKCLDNQNSGSYSNIIASIYYAIDNGARVLNMSLGGSGVSAAFREAIDQAFVENVIVVACMMNENNEVTYYPAGFANTIAVGSTNPNDQRSSPFFWRTTSGSNFGNHIDVVAPGNFIYGLNHTSNTNFGSYWGGTSQAAPHVSGLVSLLLAQDPTRRLEEIRRLIRNNAVDQVGLVAEDTPGWDKFYGFGRINAFKTLEEGILSVAGINLVQKAWQVFPVPASDVIMVENDKGKVLSSCKMVDMLGREWAVQTTVVHPGLTEVKIPQGCKGQTVIRWISEGQVFHRPILIL